MQVLSYSQLIFSVRGPDIEVPVFRWKVLFCMTEPTPSKPTLLYRYMYSVHLASTVQLGIHLRVTLLPSETELQLEATIYLGMPCHFRATGDGAAGFASMPMIALPLDAASRHVGPKRR